MILTLILFDTTYNFEIRFVAMIHNYKTWSVGGSDRRVSIQLSAPLEAEQRTEALLIDPSTDRPTNGIRQKNTMASDRKIVQGADSVPCLGKMYLTMASDRIENLAR